MTLERIVAYDFISIYPSSFGLKGENIHGDNALKFSEFSARHEMMKKAMGILLSKSFVDFTITSDGYKYCITDKGITFAEQMQNSYTRKVRLNVINVEDAYHDSDDISISKTIIEKAIEAVEN